VNEQVIIIYTDGSSIGNPGPGGWGAVLAFSLELIANSRMERVIEIGGREDHTTNNRMELIGAIEAFKKISEFIDLYKLQATSYKLSLYTDSSYLINGITKWIHGWQKGCGRGRRRCGRGQSSGSRGRYGNRPRKGRGPSGGISAGANHQQEHHQQCGYAKDSNHTWPFYLTTAHTSPLHEHGHDDVRIAGVFGGADDAGAGRGGGFDEHVVAL